MTLFERFDKHQTAYVSLLMVLYLAINNGINATSDWMETTRDGSPDFALWEPFVWEYSSALSNLILLPLIFMLWRRMPLSLTRIKTQIVQHLLLALIFSAAHVTIMVLLREGVYWFVGGNYDFGPILREFFYECRKDVWGYMFFLSLYHLYHFVYRRLKGEANLIDAESTGNKYAQVPEHLLVKKLDREFLVRVDDIEWMESSGNYVNLYSGGRIYPLRSTLAELTDRLRSKGFSRIHRSYAVNHYAIDHISYQSSGDGEIHLKNGHKLNLSRRYKDEFKQKLA